MTIDSDLDLIHLYLLQFVVLQVHSVETDLALCWKIFFRAQNFKIFDKIKLEYFRSLRHFETEQVEESHLRGGDIHGIDSDIVQPDHSPGTGMRQHKLMFLHSTAPYRKPFLAKIYCFIPIRMHFPCV